MNFEYFESTKKDLSTILGDLTEFQDQIETASEPDDVSEVAVRSLTPGLSGAAVFLIRRVGPRNRFTPWVVKVCKDSALIIEERKNNERLIQGTLPGAPVLMPSGSSRMLIFRFGADLAEYHPRTLRSGYALSSGDALATLMRRIVESLDTIHRLSDDVASCVDRMPLVERLDERIPSLNPPLPADVAGRLIEGWHTVLASREQFPRIRSTAHGDLNSGNILFEPGDVASQPVFIDFASMRRSKDNQRYPDFCHLPFWDYAKLERDLQTRLFLTDATTAALSTDEIVGEIRRINGRADSSLSTASPSAGKLVASTLALRRAIQNKHPPAHLTGCYRVVLAYGMLTVLFRERPDPEVPQDLQYLVAAESAIALLSDPFGVLSIPGVPRIAASSPVVSPQLSADEQKLVGHLYRFEGVCKIGAATGEFESLWCPGERCDMQWGWERTLQEVQASGKRRGDRTERLRWIFVVRDLVGKGVLKELPKKKSMESTTFYELTDVGWRAGHPAAALGVTAAPSAPSFELTVLSPKNGSRVPHAVPFEGTLAHCPPGMELWLVNEPNLNNFHPSRGPVHIEGGRWFGTAFLGNRMLGADTDRPFKVHVVLVAHETGRRFQGYLDQAHVTGGWVGLPSLYDGQIISTVEVVRDDGAG